MTHHERPREISADPIITPIAIALINIGIPSAIAIAGANIVVGAAISIGLSAASSLLQKRSNQSGFDASSQQPLNTPEVRYSTRQAAPPKRIIVGTALVGGALAFEQVKAPYLTHLFLINAGEITGVRDIFVGTNQVAILKTGDGSYIPDATIITPLGNLVDGEITSSPDYASYLRVCVRLGSESQAVDPLLLARYPSIGSDFRQQGHATACVDYHYGANFDVHQALWGNGGQPNPLFLVDGVAIPDPRDPTQIVEYDPNDDDEVAAAKATWRWSNNASLVQAFYLTQRFGGRIDPRRIDWDRVADAANYDDELVGTNEGVYIKRHTIDGLIALDQSPSGVLSGMLASNRGFVIDSGRKVWVTSSRPRTPTVTIHDGLLVGGIEYQAAKPKRDLINTARSRFISLDREYNLVDGPTLSRDDLIEEDGEVLESSPIDLPFVTDHRRVQRLQKAFLESSRLGKTLTVHCSLKLLTEAGDELIGACCNFSSELFGEANGTYLITQVAFADNNFSSLDVSMIEYDPDIERNWDFATDEADFTLPEVDVS